MIVLIAPDSFKESLSARAAAHAIEAGFRDIFLDAAYVLIPMADGGEGTVAAMADAMGGVIRECTVSGPLSGKVTARFALCGTTAVLEMASASGLALVPSSLRNPFLTSSYGTGEMIAAALDAGADHLVIGIGGSATNDGGAGMLQALGVRLLDHNGTDIGRGGICLKDLHRIDTANLDSRLRECRIDVACDVNNPLTGSSGASMVFGHQKGASPEMAAELDRYLQHFAAVIKAELGRDIEQTPGSGAAGGMGAALLAFLNASLRPGVEIVMEAVQLEDAVKRADLVITGEGCLDLQSLHGKAPVGVAQMARRYGRTVIGIAGMLGADSTKLRDAGFDAVFSSIPCLTNREELLTHAAENLRLTAHNVASLFKCAKDHHDSP